MTSAGGIIFDPVLPVPVIALPPFSVTVTFWLVAVGARHGGLIVSSG